MTSLKVLDAEKLLEGNNAVCLNFVVGLSPFLLHNSCLGPQIFQKLLAVSYLIDMSLDYP